MTETIAMKSIHEGLADVLDYPDADWQSLSMSAQNSPTGESAVISEAFNQFRDEVERLSLSDLQEALHAHF